MKKVRILSGLLVVMMLLSMTTSVFAVSSGKEVLSDVPFDYMENLKMRSFDNYESLSTGDKKLVYSIPDGIAESLTTEALLETILNNEYLTDLLAYNDFVEAVKSREAQFRIIEFLERKDSIEVLNSNIKKYSDKLLEKEIETGCYIQNLTEDMDVADVSPEVISYFLQINFMELLKENATFIVNDLNLFQNRLLPQEFVESKAGNSIPCYKNRGWENVENTTRSIEIAKRLDHMDDYAVTEVSGISPVYNCHSYAWYSTDYETNNVWVEDDNDIGINTYFFESTSATHNIIADTTRVVYYYEYGSDLGEPTDISHSALVYSLKSNGEVNKVISKWGNNCLFIHSIEDSPYYFVNRPIAYRNY